MSLFNSKKPKKVCFVCGSQGSYVSWDALSATDPTEFRCVQCSVDEGDYVEKSHWMAQLIETIVRKKKVKMTLLQEVSDG